MGSRRCRQIIGQRGFPFFRHGTGNQKKLSAPFLQFPGNPDLQTLNIFLKCLGRAIVFHPYPSLIFLLPKLPWRLWNIGDTGQAHSAF